jgi:hypothetical protein
MTEPECDDGAIHTGLQQLQGHRVSKQMDGDPFPLQRRAHSGGVRAVLAQHVLHPVNAQRLAPGVGKQHLPVAPWRLTQPGLQYRGRRLGQWRASLLAAFADDADVSAGSEDEVLASGRSDLRQAQTCLDRHQDKRVIAPSEPGAPVRSGEQGIDFRTREEADEPAREALAGNSEHTLDLRGVGRQLEGGITKERVYGCQPEVTAANAQALILLQVIEKRHDQGRIDLFERQRRGRLVQPLLGELQELTERVAIGAGSRFRAEDPGAAYRAGSWSLPTPERDPALSGRAV